MKKTILALLVLMGCVSWAVAEEPIKASIAVMTIEDKSGRFQANMLDQLTDYLRTKIGATGKFIIIDKSRQEAELKKMVREQKKESYKECYDRSCQIPLGQALAADSILRGTFTQIGDECTFNCELIDLAKEATVAAATADFDCTPKQAKGAIDRVVADLTGTGAAASAPAPTPPAEGERASGEPVYLQPTGVLVERSEMPFPFTDGDWNVIRGGRCHTGEGLMAARRLKARGFTAQDFVSACEDAQTHSPSDMRYIEALAVWRYMGIPMNQFDAYKSVNDSYRQSGSSISMTDYYNQYMMGGKGMKIGGWVTFGVGAGIAALGGLLWTAPSGDILGPTYVILGGVVAVVGLPLGIAGSVKTARWLPANLLDEGKIDDLEPYRREYKASRDPDRAGTPDSAVAGSDSTLNRVQVAPIISPKAYGVGVGIAF